jgi:hypothetical protein
MARSLTPALRTIFADLSQQVETAPPSGTIYTRAREGIEYVYAKVAIGAHRVDRFLGRADDPPTEEKAATLQRGMELARQRRGTVSMLRREGFAGPDKIQGATLHAIAHAGLFERGAVLIGTTAYMLSEALVGEFLPSATLATQDVDIAAADLTLSADPPEAMETILQHADPTFRPVPQLDPRKPPARFMSASGFLVDLVTPMFRAKDPNPMPLKNLEAGAVPLQYLRWLIEDPIPVVALWRAGVSVRVPQPARFAVHKLILAQRRHAVDMPKRQKDLAQAAALMNVLRRNDFFALEDALDDARAQGDRGWAEPIDRSLAEIGASARQTGYG